LWVRIPQPLQKNKMEINKEKTIGGHILKDLSFNGEYLVGYVSNKYNPDDFEKTTWSKCNVEGYYCSQLGESFDIDLSSI
jgi:hypothetical protein